MNTKENGGHLRHVQLSNIRHDAHRAWDQFAPLPSWRYPKPKAKEVTSEGPAPAEEAK